MRGVKAMAGRLEASYERHRSSGLSLRTRKARWRLGGGWSFGETKRSLVSVGLGLGRSKVRSPKSWNGEALGLSDRGRVGRSVRMQQHAASDRNGLELICCAGDMCFTGADSYPAIAANLSADEVFC